MIGAAPIVSCSGSHTTPPTVTRADLGVTEGDKIVPQAFHSEIRVFLSNSLTIQTIP